MASYKILSLVPVRPTLPYSVASFLLEFVYCTFISHRHWNENLGIIWDAGDYSLDVISAKNFCQWDIKRLVTSFLAESLLVRLNLKKDVANESSPYTNHAFICDVSIDSEISS